MNAASWGPLGQALLVLYYLVLGTLAIYGVHRLHLVIVYWKTRRNTPPRRPEPEVWPRVTVQLPLYNERYVAERLIDAVAALDYPRDRLEIQVLDDSTDDTAAIVAARVAHQRAQGLDIHHVRRSDRSGFKAGALAAGLAAAKGDLLAVFDADFVPQPSFLRETVPHLAADPTLGMVQARWSHINRDYSLLTRIQAILLDGHFLIEHTARHRGGSFFNFNGTAGVWRRQAIEDAGGWEHDTVTEDLDLSYRSQLAGWSFLYLPDVTAPAELPVDINAFKGQQRRWAKGSVQTGRKLLGRLLTAKVPWGVKFEAFVHLTNNLAYPLMALLSLLVFPAMLLRRGSSWATVLTVDLPLFLAATCSVLVFYVASQIAQGEGWLRRLRDLPALMGLGIGLSLTTAPAVLSGLFSKGGTFVRTPKYAIARRGQGWHGKRYRAGGGSFLLVEGLFALYFTGSAAYAVKAGMWPSLPFLLLFLQGHSYIFWLGVLPMLAGRRRLRAEASAEG